MQAHTQSNIIKHNFLFQPASTAGSAIPSATGIPVDASVSESSP